MRVLVWHVHGGWMDGFVRGKHEYLVPEEPGHDLPPAVSARVRALPPERLREAEPELVVLQRLEELELTERLLGRRPGRDIPAVFVEHNTPKRSPVSERHPLADQTDIPIVHVTHFNRLVWDCGGTPTRVIEHGIPDPGERYTGELPSLGVVINEPVRRGRVVGTDLLPRFSSEGRLDCFGIDTGLLRHHPDIPEDRLLIAGDLATDAMHTELARRRAYLHPMRWTSLGLSLLEAMHLAMPVIVLAATEAPRAVPPEAGAISSDPEELAAAARRLLRDPEEARRRGALARAFARERYGLDRFLADWDALLTEQGTRRPASRSRAGAAAAATASAEPAGPAALEKGTDR